MRLITLFGPVSVKGLKALEFRRLIRHMGGHTSLPSTSTHIARGDISTTVSLLQCNPAFRLIYIVCIDQAEHSNKGTFPTMVTDEASHADLRIDKR